MAINAYIGIPGSGKTYEVVHSVILPAFLKGRRVVTNIIGIDEEKFLNYAEQLNSKNNTIDFNKLGKIVTVSDDDVLQDNFFPYKGSSDDETIAKNGDLICIDEIWRIFDESKKIKENHRSFIAEHRHFTNHNGDSCDLVVISQSMTTIPRFIKDRVETTYKMTKLKSLGLNSRYRIDVYSGSKTFKTNLTHSIQAKYDPKIFDLYKSYDGNNAKEQAIDDRGNLLKSASFKLKVIFSLIFMIGGGFYLYKFYQDKVNVNDEENIFVSDEHKITAEKPLLSSNAQQKLETIKGRREQKKSIENAPISTTWRIVGYLNKNNQKMVILSDGSYLRYEEASKFQNSGNLLIGEIDGMKVTIYSGNHKLLRNSKEFKF